MHYKLVSFLVSFGFTFTDLSQWYKYSNVCYCNPYVSACCILSLHFTLFSLCIAFVGFNSLTDFAFRWSSRFIRKLRMRRAVAVAVGVAAALLPALLFCELLAQNKTESSNKFWALGLEFRWRQRVFWVFSLTSVAFCVFLEGCLLGEAPSGKSWPQLDVPTL